MLVSMYKIRLRNDLYCVEWGVKLYSLTHSMYKNLSNVVYQKTKQESNLS